MGDSSQQPVTQQTQQTRDPWVQAQPFLNQVMGGAANLYNNTVGYSPYMGQTQAPLENNLGLGLASQASVAQNYQGLAGTAGNAAAQGLATNMIQNQGLTPGLQSMLEQYGTMYNEAAGTENPYLQGMLATSNQRIGDRINSSMSGAGRYGSGQHTDVMSRALAEAANPILAEDFARRQAQRMAITGAQTGIYGGGLERAGQWAQLQPALEAAQYGPAQQFAATGQYLQERDQAALNDSIKQYNANQAYPWEQLARYNAIVGGAGGLGGTTVTSSPINQPSTMQRIFGGGLAGAGIGSTFGGAPGAAVGAGVGGLLGLL